MSAARWITISVLVCLGQAWAIQQQKTKTTIVSGTLERNVDGDTTIVNSTATPHVRYKIRMIGMDAPEQHLPAAGGMVGQGHFGEDATDYINHLVSPGAKVTFDDLGLDKYGRTLGRVFYNGKDINLAMVEGGWAIPYIICQGAGCRPAYFAKQNADAYFAACNQAREDELGIWDPQDRLKEMPFEFRLRMQKRKADKIVGDYRTKLFYAPADYAKVDVCYRVFFLNQADATQAGFKKAN